MANISRFFCKKIQARHRVCVCVKFIKSFIFFWTKGFVSVNENCGGINSPFLGLRVNDQRVGAAANQRWLDHQQAQQWNSQGSQWAPHAGGPAAPQPWPLANAAQPVSPLFIRIRFLYGIW